jgi:RNA polymerase sigma factor (sigma-70 family)
MNLSSTGVRDMTANPVLHFLRIFRRRASAHESQEQSDGRLLERFVGGDGDALGTLVRRHAPMVWAVCRRNLARPDDAEDAFQATFLVLLRKAGTIWPRERLANWLYGVAYKTACKARQTAAKLGAREQQGWTVPEPMPETSDDTLAELLGHLDTELNRLPEKYRTAIVLCDLQERTIRDVAQELRVKEGTVASRLARGREMLAQRMIRHSAGLSAVTVAAVCSQQSASGALPTALLTRTIDAVRLMAAEQPVMAGMLSAEASTLSEAVLHSMAATKWKAASVVLLLAALAIGGGVVAYHNLPDQPQTPDPSDAEMYGTAAGATSFAKTYLYEHNSLDLAPAGLLYSHAWPSRDFKATFDPKNHQWTVTGAYRWDVTPGSRIAIDANGQSYRYDNDNIEGGDREYRSYEKEWKLVLSYNPMARAYGVQKAERFASRGREGWRTARTDDLGKWLQGRYTKPSPSATPPVTALRLVLDGPDLPKLGPEPKFSYFDSGSFRRRTSDGSPTPVEIALTKLGLEPKYSYASKNIVVEPNRIPGFGDRSFDGPGVVTVRVDDDPVAGVPAKQWTLAFGAPFNQSFKAGEYGGACSPEAFVKLGSVTLSSGPLITVRVKLLGVDELPGLSVDGRPLVDAYSPGEFVVREIELKNQKIVRLAIDFITDTGYGLPTVDKRGRHTNPRRIVRGSLRFNSRFELSVPELDPDAAE